MPLRQLRQLAGHVVSAVLRWCVSDLAEPFVGDLLEEAAHMATSHSARPGPRLWLAGQLLRSLPHLALMRLRSLRDPSSAPDRKRSARRGAARRRFVLATATLGSSSAALVFAAGGFALLARRTAPRVVELPSPADPPLAERPLVEPPPPPIPAVPPLALVLVLDRSGSMSATERDPNLSTGSLATSRLQLAIEGARRAVRTLSMGDAVGVIAFDYDATWIAPPAQLTSGLDVTEVETRLGRITPDGGTDIYRALELAYRGLLTTIADAKHVILLTDGEQGSPAPFPTLVAAMQRASITVSTIGVNTPAGGPTAVLENIARAGQGRYLAVNTPAELPELFARETLIAVGRAHARGDAFI